MVLSAAGTIEKSPGFQLGGQGSHQAHESRQGRHKTIQYDPYLMKNVAALPSLRDSDSCVNTRSPGFHPGLMYDVPAALSTQERQGRQQQWNLTRTVLTTCIAIAGSLQRQRNYEFIHFDLQPKRAVFKVKLALMGGWSGSRFRTKPQGRHPETDVCAHRD